MKKFVKGAGLSLCAMLLLAGCSCNKDEKDTTANISNQDDKILDGLKDGVDSISLEKLYNELRNEKGNETAANKLLQMVSDLVLSDATWEARYEAKVQYYLDELKNNSAYFVDGEFNEEYLVKVLKAQLYNITKTGDVYDYTDYVNKALKAQIIGELLNEKYVYDKVMVDKTNILSTKKARRVEYVGISYSNDEEEGDVVAHIKDAIAQLSAENATITLKDIADSWTAKKLVKVQEKFDKINTKEDSNGSIMQEFTDGYTRTPEEGLEIKKREVEQVEYYDDVTITSDSKDILNTTLVERILSENILSDTAKKTIKVNNSYYLVAPWAGNNITSSDMRIKDSSNSKS